MTIDQGLKARAIELLAAAIAKQFDTPIGFVLHDLSQEPTDWQLAALDAVSAALSRTPSPSLPSREAIARNLFATNFHPDEDVRLIAAKWDEWPDDQRRAFRQADAILSLLPVNGWRERVEAARQIALAEYDRRCKALSKAREECDAGQAEKQACAAASSILIAHEILALSAAPGEGAS